MLLLCTILIEFFDYWKFVRATFYDKFMLEENSKFFRILSQKKQRPNEIQDLTTASYEIKQKSCSSILKY